MKRWALVVVGSLMACYLLLGFVLPTHTSSGDEVGGNSSIAAQDGTDLDRGTTEKKRPSLGGSAPAATATPKVAKSEPPKEETKTTTKRYTRDEKTKSRPSLLGPKTPPPASKVPEVPVATAQPGVAKTPAGPIATATPSKPVTPTTSDVTIEQLRQEIEQLKSRIAMLTASGVGDDQAKAAAILELATKQMEVMKQANKKQAELDFAAAQSFFSAGSITEAYLRAKRAAELDPDNAVYASFLLQLEEMKGVATPDLAQKYLLEEEVKMRQMLAEINLRLDEAQKLYSEATVASGLDAVEMLKSARMKLGSAQFSLNAISAKFRPAGIEKRITDLIKLVDDLMRTKSIEQKDIQNKTAEAMARQASEVEEKFLIARINDLVNRAYLAIHNEQFKQAELLLEKVIKLDPANREAKYLLRIVQKKGDLAKEKQITERSILETRRSLMQIDEYIIPYNDIIVYPDNWEEINRTRSGFTEMRTEEEPEWKKLIRARMGRKINVNFIDTPLVDVVATLRDLVDVTIIVDPESSESVSNTVTLTLKNMTFETALEWVLRIVGLQWALDREAIFIATADRIQGDKIMQIYDVRDLIGAITNFPGPNISLGDENEPEIEMPETPDPEELLEQLVEMIKTKIEPNSWDEAAGASVTGREGKLIVTNVPRIHVKIEQLLDSFRKAQKLQVYINARFVQVQDDFLEDIGVSWSGLDRDATTDLAGIANNIPAGFASDPAKRTGGWDAYDLRGVILNTTTNSIIGYSPNTGYQAGEGLNLSYALLGNFQAEVILNAIQKTQRGHTLLAPRITVFNTQRAYMMVATVQAYIADYEGLIATQAAILDPVIKTFTTGMVLDVRPIISSDRKYITIEMRPTSAVLLQLLVYEINALLWGTNYAVFMPRIQLQKVRTTVALPDNGVLLLGGQIYSFHHKLYSGIPFLSKLPIVGRLFSSNAELKDRLQLLIFVNARIIMFEEIEEDLRAR